MEQVNFRADDLIQGLFSGTIHVVHLACQIGGDTNNVVQLSSDDIAMAIKYLTLASKSISRYVSQYGLGSITVNPTPLLAPVSVPSNSSYDDGWVRGWVNTIAKDSGIPATDCIVILNPPGMTNTTAKSENADGYHDFANCAYVWSDVRGAGLTLDDSGFLYAAPLSHEVAEMSVDAHVGSGNPEVCDDCANNCGHLTLNCFNADGTFAGSVTDAIINFPYSFFIFRSHAAGLHRSVSGADTRLRLFPRSMVTAARERPEAVVGGG